MEIYLHQIRNRTTDPQEIKICKSTLKTVKIWNSDEMGNFIVKHVITKIYIRKGRNPKEVNSVKDLEKLI